MRVTSASDFRKNMARELDRVHDDIEPLMIFRTGGKPAGVLMSVELFESWQETVYLTRSPANAEALLKSIAEYDQGKLVEHNLAQDENSK